MFLRKLGKRGAEMVEYAIVLACIAAVGVGFYSSRDSRLTEVLDNLFGNVAQVIGLTDSGKHPLKYTNLEHDVVEALKYQFDIPYNYVSEALATADPGAQLQAIELNKSGGFKNIWYSDADGKLIKLDNGIKDTYNTEVQKLYKNKWDIEALTDTGFRAYRANADKSGMFVAYDKFGNVVEKVNASNLKGNEIANVENFSTNVYFKKDQKSNQIYKYEYTDAKGFQQVTY